MDHHPKIGAENLSNTKSGMSRKNVSDGNPFISQDDKGSEKLAPA